MKVTRIYTGDDGESHFEDIDIPLGESIESDRRSELIKATGIIFRETGADYDLDWHNAPRRQFGPGRFPNTPQLARDDWIPLRGEVLDFFSVHGTLPFLVVCSDLGLP